MTNYPADLTPEALLAMATTFTVIPYDPNHRVLRLQTVQVIQTHHNPQAWCISSGGSSVLSRDGEWEWQPQPSSRTDDFLERTRWSDPREAIMFALDHLKRNPTGYLSE